MAERSLARLLPLKTRPFTANFTTQYYLTMAHGTGGTVTPASGWKNSGATVSITARPATGYSFGSWASTGTGSVSGTTNPASITMGGPITETATFTLSPPTPTPTPTATATPTATPTPTADPDGYTDANGDTDTSIRRGRLQSRRWRARSQLDEAAGVGTQPGHRQQPGRGGCREQPQLCLLVG